MPASDLHGARAESPLMTTLRRFERAHKAGAVHGLGACSRDGAIIDSVASGGRALGADATADAPRDAFAASLYLITDWSYEPLSDDLVIVTSTVRHRSSNGGASHHVVHRATVGRNGLI